MRTSNTVHRETEIVAVQVNLFMYKALAIADGHKLLVIWLNESMCTRKDKLFICIRDVLNCETD